MKNPLTTEARSHGEIRIKKPFTAKDTKQHEGKTGVSSVSLCPCGGLADNWSPASGHGSWP